MFMVITNTTRNDTAIRVSKWLDKEIENYISDRKIKITFPSKRNFVDSAIMQLLEKRGIKLNGGTNGQNRKGKRNVSKA